MRPRVASGGAVLVGEGQARPRGERQQGGHGERRGGGEVRDGQARHDDAGQDDGEVGDDGPRPCPAEHARPVRGHDGRGNPREHAACHEHGRLRALRHDAGRAERVAQRARRADQGHRDDAGAAAREAHERLQAEDAEEKHGHRAQHREEVDGVEHVEALGIPHDEAGHHVVHEQAQPRQLEGDAQKVGAHKRHRPLPLCARGLPLRVRRDLHHVHPLASPSSKLPAQRRHPMSTHKRVNGLYGYGEQANHTRNHRPLRSGEGPHRQSSCLYRR